MNKILTLTSCDRLPLKLQWPKLMNKFMDKKEPEVADTPLPKACTEVFSSHSMLPAQYQTP